MTTNYYRWNVHPVWENISSAFEEAYHSRRAQKNSFMRCKHIRSLLYFASTGVEAFFNSLMRDRMTGRGNSEEEIFKKLRHTKFREKVTDWPSEICQSRVDIESDISELFDLFQEYYDLRGNLTHPKDKDHSIYLALDQLDPERVVRIVQEILLRVLEALQQSYPYWLLGWNYVGFGRDDAHPCLSDLAQFRHSLARMGLIDRSDAWDYDRGKRWEQEWMLDRKGFARLTTLLDGYPEDIEPWFEFAPGLGSPPRLCRRWWDHDYIISTIPKRS